VFAVLLPPSSGIVSGAPLSGPSLVQVRRLTQGHSGSCERTTLNDAETRIPAIYAGDRDPELPRVISREKDRGDFESDAFNRARPPSGKLVDLARTAGTPDTPHVNATLPEYRNYQTLGTA
jgi:hypothetical protein